MNRTAVVVLVLVAAGWAAAQAPTDPSPLTLEQALALAPDASATVLSARADLDAARRSEARVTADPASLRVDRLSAHDATVNAERALAAALAGDRASVASAYFDAAQADTALSVARLEVAIQQQTLKAEQARLDAGAATDLDVAKAQNSLHAAEATLAKATTDRALAFNTLASLVGRAVGATTGEVALPALEPLDSYLQRARQDNAQLVAANGAAALAQAQLQAVDNDFSARSTVQQAQDTLADAQRHVGEVQRTLDLSVKGAYANAQTSAAALTNARAADVTAQDDLTAAQARLDAGVISPLAFRSSQLTRLQASQALEVALHTAVLRLYTLEQVVAGN